VTLRGEQPSQSVPEDSGRASPNPADICARIAGNGTGSSPVPRVAGATVRGVKIAGGVDLDAILGRLAELRPIFHSEADFQFALAWQVKVHAPHVQVRLETRPAPPPASRPGLSYELDWARDRLFGAPVVWVVAAATSAAMTGSASW